MTDPLGHFIELAKAGNTKEQTASSGEFAAARIANALARSACLLDDLALQAIAGFAFGAKHAPELAAGCVGTPKEDE